MTRHLPQLLSGRAWDVLLLHYLGVDHAGHLGGPTGPLMPSKLVEMDEIVGRLWRSIETRDVDDGRRTLLVVLGDHGMTAAGNHGGASAGETSTVCRDALLQRSSTRHSYWRRRASTRQRRSEVASAATD